MPVAGAVVTWPRRARHGHVPVRAGSAVTSRRVMPLLWVGTRGGSRHTHSHWWVVAYNLCHISSVFVSHSNGLCLIRPSLTFVHALSVSALARSPLGPDVMTSLHRNLCENRSDKGVPADLVCVPRKRMKVLGCRKVPRLASIVGASV